MEHPFLEALGVQRVDMSRLRPEVKRLKPDKETGANAQVQRLKKMRQACSDVEAIFAQSLITAMRRTIPGGGHLMETPGADIYDSMAYDQMAIYLTRDPGLGLGQAMFDQMVLRENLEDVVAEHPELAGTHTLGQVDLSGLAKVSSTKGETHTGGRVLRSSSRTQSGELGLKPTTHETQDGNEKDSADEETRK